MTHPNLGAIACAVAVALGLVAPCYADLFAMTTTGDRVMRIDSTTGAITRSYPLPDYFPPTPPTSGMAFDGRILYLARSTPIHTDILFLDVVDHLWYPPVLAETYTPPNNSHSLGGLGFRPDEFGGSLIGVSRFTANVGPSHIFQYPIWSQPIFDPLLININFPPGELPANLSAHGADIDPATGDLWITADEVSGNMVLGRRLIRSDMTGAVLQTLIPAVPPVTMIRGLGFDEGAMFVAGRHLPSLTNSIFEIDQTTGAVIRSFPIPDGGLFGALTGGEVIPEPTSALLVALALAGVISCRPLRRSL